MHLRVCVYKCKKYLKTIKLIDFMAYLASLSFLFRLIGWLTSSYSLCSCLAYVFSGVTCHLQLNNVRRKKVDLLGLCKWCRFQRTILREHVQMFAKLQLAPIQSSFSLSFLTSIVVDTPRSKRGKKLPFRFALAIHRRASLTRDVALKPTLKMHFQPIK